MLTTLHSFNSSDGSFPQSGLVLGGDSNFYGTTAGGGLNGFGTVFQFTTAGVLTTIYNFSGSDGQTPAAGLVSGQDGNLYGTTQSGGAYDSGTVFEITPAGVLTTLYSFTGGSDGGAPEAALIQGSDGNFYGTTSLAGGITSNGGTCFKITTAGTFTSLHSFDYHAGATPMGSLVQGGDGSFYGTTSFGGTNGGGTVFKITPTGGFTTLYNFTGSGSDGFEPLAGLALGNDGNFYGTTEYGGPSDSGTVFQITPAGDLTILYDFGASNTSGIDGGDYPVDTLVLGHDGNFYGTTEGGGGEGQGSIFQITPGGVLTTLYGFGTVFGEIDGYTPLAGLVQGDDGAFYGTTQYGGENGDGTVFKLTVNTQPTFFTNEVQLSNNVYYLTFPNGNFFGYYSFLSPPQYIYHFDLGYEYVFDAADGKSGVYLYDFASDDFFYTSPTFPFPYLYDFNLNTVLYYYPDPNNPGHYNTDGIRFFYDFKTGTIITK